jgi:hypothetical protein
LEVDWEEVDLPEACDRHNKGEDVCYYCCPVGEEPWRDGRFGGELGGFIEPKGNSSRKTKARGRIIRHDDQVAFAPASVNAIRIVTEDKMRIAFPTKSILLILSFNVIFFLYLTRKNTTNNPNATPPIGKLR